jgi:hypothetical protein
VGRLQHHEQLGEDLSLPANRYPPDRRDKASYTERIRMWFL